MDNILNGKFLNRGHGFGVTDNHFTDLGLSTPIDQPQEKYAVVYFKNPKQSWFDKFWNGEAYIFMTLDFIQENLIQTEGRVKCQSNSSCGTLLRNTNFAHLEKE